MSGDGPAETLFIGGGGAGYGAPQRLALRYANRHGLIAGATGTGKTVSLQILAEGFSAAGVPVFLSDVKGDLSGLAAAGSPEHKLHDKLLARAETIGLTDYGYAAQPVVFWDVYGEQGHPVRATVSEMGPLLLSRMLDLNETQEGVLNVVFRAADDEGLLLLDLKDLRAMLREASENAKALSDRYGRITSASIGAIQRRLLTLETQGADQFFGEPALKLADLMRVDGAGRGQVNVLAADRLMRSPRLYATFLLWLLSELFEELPEVGDPDKPVLAFFFDEAHLLFDDAPKTLLQKVEQVARLIRSKGVGVYFVTQNPADVPDDVLGQLGNRIQHALRAYTPKDRKAVRAAAQTFRPNPAFDAESAITELGVGEALVSTLEAKGAPSVVERTLIRPPSSRLGPLSEDERRAAVAASPLADVYDQALDRESAYERLSETAAPAGSADWPGAAEPSAGGGRMGGRYGEPYGSGADETGGSGSPWDRHRREPSGGAYRGPDRAPSWRDRAEERSYEAPSKRSGSRSRDGIGDAFFKSLARSVGTRLGKSVLRGVLGGLFKGR